MLLIFDSLWQITFLSNPYFSYSSTFVYFDSYILREFPMLRDV